MNKQGTTPPAGQDPVADESDQFDEELAEDAEEREPTEVEVLQGEMALLEQQLQQMRDRYIHAVADLDNARKRAKQAIGDARHQAVVGLLQELLPLMDNFERALESSIPTPETPAETTAVYEGVSLIYRQLKRLLEQRGVHPIEAMGQPFDPDLHEAMLQVPASKEHPEGTVAVETQRGYRYGSQVIRHSRVGVAVKAG
jgi:molecular chaperone GrpE